MPRLSLTALEDRWTPAFGDLDPTFGSGGTASLTVPDFTPSVVAVAPDGGTLIGGRLSTTGGIGTYTRPAVVRLTPAGGLDAGFGTGGVADLGEPYGSPNVTTTALAVAADGRVTAVGGTTDQTAGVRVSLIRLTAAGQRDLTFGTVAGRVDVAVQAASAVALAPDGGVVLVGTNYGYDYSSGSPPSGTYVTSVSVLRLTPTGQSDAGFNGGRPFPFDSVRQISAKATGAAVMSDGRVVIGGSFPTAGSADTFGAIRLTADGRLDPTFSGDGVAALPTGQFGVQPTGVAVRSDGAVALTAGATTGISAGRATIIRQVVAKFKPDGSLDPSFGGGVVTNDTIYSSLSPVINFTRDGVLVTADPFTFYNVAAGVQPPAAVRRFAADGKVTSESFVVVGSSGSAAVLPNGQVVWAGSRGVFRTQGLARPAAGDFFAGGSPDGFAQRVTAAGEPGDRYEVFPTFTGTVRTATADLTGDGVPDLIAGAGPGATPNVQIVSGATGQVLADFFAFEKTFTGGLFVTAADLDGDGVPEVVVTPDRGGGPAVAVFRVDGTERARFFGIEDANFRGGARATAGDIDGDGRPDLVVAAGFGGGPRLAVYAGTTVLQSGGRVPRRLVDDFYVFEQSLRNGVYVSALDITGDGAAEVVVGGGPGGGPRVLALDGKALVAGRQTPVADFFGGNPESRGGARLGVTRTADGRQQLATGNGPGENATMRLYSVAAVRTGVPDVVLLPFSYAILPDGVYVG